MWKIQTSPNLPRPTQPNSWADIQTLGWYLKVSDYQTVLSCYKKESRFVWPLGPHWNTVVTRFGHLNLAVRQVGGQVTGQRGQISPKHVFAVTILQCLTLLSEWCTLRGHTWIWLPESPTSAANGDFFGLTSQSRFKLSETWLMICCSRKGLSLMCRPIGLELTTPMVTDRNERTIL